MVLAAISLVEEAMVLVGISMVEGAMVLAAISMVEGAMVLAAISLVEDVMVFHAISLVENLENGPRVAASHRLVVVVPNSKELSMGTEWVKDETRGVEEAESAEEEDRAACIDLARVSVVAFRVGVAWLALDPSPDHLAQPGRDA
ncbi:hypothetical protein RRG08_034085 [Elysia crispata]|uniref:Uncharacterized protein n=1 Tax=Elysia crispata TaxID=231223 RepID=A0AAE0YT16_9GAST|nr:hypothetical protein RRG08_034085 [Elysia crispata]